VIKAFKMGAANYLRSPYNRDELREIVEQTLAQKLRYVNEPSIFSHVHEKIEFELPSDLALMTACSNTCRSAWRRSFDSPGTLKSFRRSRRSIRQPQSSTATKTI
jgi:DNA-binding NtrC family response regulator